MPHRLRDLDRRGRTSAALLALGLALIPFVAAAVNHGRWQPQGDDALIELRAHDVFTARNPLIGQPSTSGSYGQQRENVAHPGPLGFVVLAPGTRLLGPVTGALASVAALHAAALVTVAWLLFRIAGPRGGAAGAVLGALAALTAGAGGLVDPLSSNLGRLPLLAAVVGVWALLCGDVRTLPITVAWWTFAAQQHLSVGPAAAVVAAAGAVGVGLAWWRPGEGGRRAAVTSTGLAALVAAVLWLPVLWEQATGDPGNLSALRSYSGDPSRVDLGLRSAVSQVSVVLGPVPFLGRSDVTGWDLVAHRSTAGVAAVLLGIGAVLAAGAWWLRRERRFVALVAMVGVLALAGVATGASIPDSPEQGRLNFFHWAFALSFLQLLALGWLVARLVARATPQLTHGRRSTAAVVGGAIVVGVALVPVLLDRSSDRLSQPLPPAAVADLVGQLRASPELSAIEGSLVVLPGSDDRYVQVADTVGARLAIDGRAVRFGPLATGFVHPSRVVAGPCATGPALTITLEQGDGGDTDASGPAGVEVARVDAAPGLDRRALARLEAQARDVHVVMGDELQAALDEAPGRSGRLLGAVMGFRLPSAPAEVLLRRDVLDLLIEHPPVAPVLDHDDLVALRASLPDGADAVAATTIVAHLSGPTC